MNILPLLDRPIAFQRSFIRLEMGVTAALFLSQLTYWTNRTTDDGWVYKTQDEWEEETGLSRYEQEGARKKLRGLGVLLERKQGLPARLYYKIDNDVLCQLLTSAYKDAEKPHTGEGKTTGLYVENQQTFLQRILQRLLLMVNRLTPTPNNLPTRE